MIPITRHRHYLSRNSFRHKLQSSICCFSSQDNHARNYLEHWAGAGRLKSRAATAPTTTPATAPPAVATGSGNTTTSPTFEIKSNPQSSLQITGSSYLLPTLCLPRQAAATGSTSLSITNDLISFLSRSSSSRTNQYSAIQSMIRPKSLPGTSTSLRVPIILDLAAFQHDGSPHYKPPCEGFLPSIVDTLDQWGITVMGLTNVPNIETIGKEVTSLGLPVLGRVGSGRVLGMNGKKGGKAAMNIEDLVQVVLKQSSHDGEKTVKGSMETQSVEDVNVSKENTCAVNNIAVEKCDHQVSMRGNHESITRDNLLSLSLSELQKTCKDLGLDATEPMSQLYDKILTCNGLEPMHSRPSENDALDDMVVPNTSQDSSSLPPHHHQSITIPPAKLYHGSVRSGQQVSTDVPNQSLVILGNVNSGGEVIADGDIYIFGHLRGRAIAGLSDSPPPMNVQDDSSTRHENEQSSSSGGGGESSSMIVCTHFDAELVCIGESFTTMDGSLEEYGLQNGKGVIVKRKQNSLSLQFISFG
jgi:Septum formation inhibitor